MERDPVIVMHSAYNHLKRWWGEGGIPFYNDKKVFEDTPPGAMALLMDNYGSLLRRIYEAVDYYPLL